MQSARSFRPTIRLCTRTCRWGCCCLLTSTAMILCIRLGGSGSWRRRLDIAAGRHSSACKFAFGERNQSSNGCAECYKTTMWRRRRRLAIFSCLCGHCSRSQLGPQNLSSHTHLARMHLPLLLQLLGQESCPAICSTHLHGVKAAPQREGCVRAPHMSLQAPSSGHMLNLIKVSQFSTWSREAVQRTCRRSYP
jgi:hypothetical protein